MDNKITYEQALGQLQDILKVIESPETGIGDIGKEIERAMELLAFCRDELNGYEKSFEQILNNKEQL